MISVPRVSVVLPVRDGAGTLASALRSVLAQTFEQIEVIVVDDRSSDGSADIAISLGDTRVRLIRGGSTPGLAARLNEGIAEARAPLVARMDADDLAFPERLARQARFLDANPEVDLLGTGALIHDSTGRATGVFPGAATHDAICAAPWRGLHLCHPTWMGRRGWFARWRYRETGTMRCEDQDLLLRSRLGSRFACLPDVLLAYRWAGLAPSKALPSRFTLLIRQIEVFAGERRWDLAAASAVAAAGKVTLDLASAAGAKRLIHRRFESPIDPALADAWAALKRSTGAFATAAWGEAVGEGP